MDKGGKAKNRKKIFPGNGFREKARIELREVFVTGANRKEFFIMVSYAVYVLFFSVITIDLLGIARSEVMQIYFLFSLMGFYFIADDFLRRKHLVEQKLLYIIDSVFYLSCITNLAILTGGFDSPLRFHLFLLAAISAPIYGTMAQMTVVILIADMIQIFMGLIQHPGWSMFIVGGFLDAFTLLAVALISKFSIDLYREKASEAEDMSQELKKLYKEAEEHSSELEMVVAEKTTELMKMLHDTEKEKDKSEKQRVATMNILEDMAETQHNLKLSKATLESRQLELEAIADLSSQLTNTTEIDRSVSTISSYFRKFFDFNALTVLLEDPSGKGGFLFKSFLNKPTGKAVIETAKNELIDFMCQYKAINKGTCDFLKATAIDYLGEKPSNQKQAMPSFNFIMPLKTGDQIFGAIHFSTGDKDFYKDPSKKEIINAITSTASVALHSLEEVAKSQQSKTETLIKSLSNGVILLNRSLEVMLVNPRATEFTGVDKTGHGLRAFLDLLGKDDIEKLIRNAFDKKKEGIIKEADIKGKMYEIYVTPVSDNENNITGTALIVHDITQARIIDQMKSEFVSVASHQLRTPLTAIRLFIEMLLRGDVGKVSAGQKDYLNNIYQSTERMVRLVNDLLNVTRIESNRMQVSAEPTQLEDLIESVINEAKPLAELKKCQISFMRPAAKTPLVKVDRNLFRQVIHNLVTNAIKYSVDNGKITIALKLDSDKAYLVSVADDGIGIPLKFQSKIFQKFSRADNAVKAETEGTGLGLYVSQKIVESFDGKIWFESEPGRGTAFHVLLPRQGMKDKVGERGLIIS